MTGRRVVVPVRMDRPTWAEVDFLRAGREVHTVGGVSLRVNPYLPPGVVVALDAAGRVLAVVRSVGQVTR